MTPSEIISADAQQHGVDPNQLLHFVHQRLQEGKSSIISAGSSILLITHLAHGAVECHLYTQDNPTALRTSLSKFMDTMRQAQVKRVYGKADNPGILQLLRLIGLDVQHSDLPRFNWMANL